MEDMVGGIRGELEALQVPSMATVLEKKAKLQLLLPLGCAIQT